MPTATAAAIRQPHAGNPPAGPGACLPIASSAKGLRAYPCNSKAVVYIVLTAGNGAHANPLRRGAGFEYELNPEAGWRVHPEAVADSAECRPSAAGW